jgi:calcineurin-like phosphoesterase family protein
MTIRYIADLHFDHTEIIAYDNRPFDTVEEMNETLIRNWNSVVGPEDLTYILGDFCAEGADRWRQHLTRLNGRKRLILGNHDNRTAAASVTDLLEDAADYREALLWQIRKKCPALLDSPGELDAEDRGKAMASLMRQGFSADGIRTLLREMSP